MKIREVSITVSRTFNLGNYESLRVEAGATASIDDTDDVADVRAGLLEEVRVNLREQHAAFKPKREQS